MGVVAFGLGGIALILTLSRGGWISLVLSLTVMCALAWYRGWLSLTVPFVLIAVGLLLALLFQDLIGARLFGDDKGSALSRIPLMQIAFQMVKDHPLLGVGSNNFATVFGQYVTPRFSQEWLYTVHNKYFLVWSETGTVALGAYLWFLISAIYRGWQGWILKDRWLSPLALGFAAAVMGQMVHMNFDIFNGRPQVQLLWLIIGLMIAILKLGNVDLTIGGAATTNKEVGNKVTL
jgi:O-antigen ligase